jgi:ABC-type transporter Mla subunit MlaD
MIDTLTSAVLAQDRKLDELAQDNRDLRDRIRNLSQNLHAAQNRKLDVLVQNNGHLRDELRHLFQTVQSSKKDIQRVENISNNMASELKGKLENMLEKSENRILGPINRLREELESIRANPPAPLVPVPSSTALLSTTPYPPEPPAGEGEWTPPDDHTPVESNKPHYQESWGNYRQPVRLTFQSSQANLIFNRH